MVSATSGAAVLTRAQEGRQPCFQSGQALGIALLEGRVAFQACLQGTGRQALLGGLKGTASSSCVSDIPQCWVHLN